jgi:hypothetical protein
MRSPPRLQCHWSVLIALLCAANRGSGCARLRQGHAGGVSRQPSVHGGARLPGNPGHRTPVTSGGQGQRMGAWTG